MATHRRKEASIQSTPRFLNSFAYSMVCARSQPPSTQSVAETLTPIGLFSGKRSADGVEHFQGIAHTVLQASAILVGPPVGDRREELMQQIAVGGVQLDRIEAEPLGAFGRRHEGIAHPLKRQRIERQRRQLALLVRHREGPSACQPPW